LRVVCHWRRRHDYRAADVAPHLYRCRVCGDERIARYVVGRGFVPPSFTFNNQECSTWLTRKPELTKRRTPIRFARTPTADTCRARI
jgi:hypothetical protein